MNYAFLYEQEFALPEAREYARLAAYSIIGFFVSFLLAGPQLLVGSVVNALLVTTALELRNWKLLPILILPSLGVLSRGLVFGPFTVYLALMIPFIWVGNALLALTVKKLYLADSRNYWVSLLAGASLKAAFLFACALALNYFGLVPAPIVAAMGLMQLVTALLGGTISRFSAKTGIARALPL
ncbi:hypothetical protein COX85_04160 [Candidatus Micrarchaeota archaeon CG_4_10_14_0_2_um_filter_55_9]|nr:MAG: hypothetical protein COX85_04160 [Candidatus Micrarchaeota archaeon CG_4_10_14_0_2_um_filter_55_9]